MAETEAVVLVGADGTVWVRSSGQTVAERYSESRVRHYKGILADVRGERDSTGTNT